MVETAEIKRWRELAEKFNPTDDLDEKARQGLVKGTIPLSQVEELETAGYVMQDSQRQYVLTPVGRSYLKAKYPEEFDVADERWVEEAGAEMVEREKQYKAHQELVARKDERR